MYQNGLLKVPQRAVKDTLTDRNGSGHESLDMRDNRPLFALFHNATDGVTDTRERAVMDTVTDGNGDLSRRDGNVY